MKKTLQDGAIPKRPTIAFLQGEIKALESFNRQAEEAASRARQELQEVYAKVGRWYINQLRP